MVRSIQRSVFATLGTFALAVLLVGAAFLAAPAARSSGKKTVVATIYPLGEIVREIGGDGVTVHALLDGSSSPHTFEIRPSHVRTASKADLLVAVGRGLDDWSIRLLQAAKEETPVVQVADVVFESGQGIPLAGGDAHEATGHGAAGDDGPKRGEEAHESGDHDHAAAGMDPHVWLDPILVRDVIAPHLAERMIEIDPARRSIYEGNLARLQERLTRLDAGIRAKLDDIPSREFISFHSAWGYFAKRYALRQAATVSDFPGQEPSAKWVAQVVRVAEDLGVRVIFAEPQMSPKAAESVAREIGGRVLLLDPLGGSEAPSRSTYFELMEYNAAMIAEAFR